MPTAACHILRASVPYKDLGPRDFLQDLGFAVENSSRDSDPLATVWLLNTTASAHCWIIPIG